MTTMVEKSVEVEVPVRTAYNQWTQFEEFPTFMGGVQEVVQVDDTTLHWVAEIAGVRREWDAEILEQVPDQKVAWAAISGATNAGAVHFAPAGPDRTLLTLHLEYEPEGLVESAGDALGIIERQAESDVRRFKELIESRGTESGAWRGDVSDEAPVGTPGSRTPSCPRATAARPGCPARPSRPVSRPPGPWASPRRPWPRAPVTGHHLRAGTSSTCSPTDHDEATALLAEISATRDGRRGATWPTRSSPSWCATPWPRRCTSTRPMRRPARREARGRARHRGAQGARALMKQLEGLEPLRPRFDEVLGELASTLQDHVADEEGSHFPQLRAALPREDLVALAAKVESAEKLAPTRPHPGAPTPSSSTRWWGPRRFVDRLRDKLSGRTTS